MECSRRDYTRREKYKGKWEKGKAIEKSRKKIYWDWECQMRANCAIRRPDLTLEDTDLEDIACI